MNNIECRELDEVVATIVESIDEFTYELAQRANRAAALAGNPVRSKRDLARAVRFVLTGTERGVALATGRPALYKALVEEAVDFIEDMPELTTAQARKDLLDAQAQIAELEHDDPAPGVGV